MIPVEVVFRGTDRNFGGSIREDAWGQHSGGQPLIDSYPGEDLDIAGIPTCKIFCEIFSCKIFCDIIIYLKLFCVN